MTDNTQPEALRLAEILEGDYCPDWFYEQGVDEVSAELRRLHAYCQELEAQAILDCMTHDQKPAEIEHVAGDVSKNGTEVSMTQQPAPTPQADSQPAPVVDRDRIREIFVAHGFTVKEGQTDLKQYVYDAADALLRAARAPADSVQEDAIKVLRADLKTSAKEIADEYAEDAARWRDWSQAFAEASAAPEDTVFMKAFEDAIGDSDAPFTAEQFTSWVDAARKQGANHD